MHGRHNESYTKPPKPLEMNATICFHQRYTYILAEPKKAILQSFKHNKMGVGVGRVLGYGTNRGEEAPLGWGVEN